MGGHETLCHISASSSAAWLASTEPDKFYLQLGQCWWFYSQHSLCQGLNQKLAHYSVGKKLFPQNQEFVQGTCGIQVVLLIGDLLFLLLFNTSSTLPSVIPNINQLILMAQPDRSSGGTHVCGQCMEVAYEPSGLAQSYCPCQQFCQWSSFVSKISCWGWQSISTGSCLS